VTFVYALITVRLWFVNFVLLKGCFVAGSEILDLVSGGVIGLGLAVGIVLVSKH